MKQTTKLLVAILAAAAHYGGAAPYQNIYTSGHADLGVAYEEEEGGMHFHYHFGSDAVINGSPLGGEGGEYDIGDVTTFVSPNTKIFVNAGSTNNSLLGLGASGGDLWVLPQVQDPSLPFLGLATEDLDAGDWNGNITFTLNSVVGPGQFSMWSSGVFGQLNFEFSTNNQGGTIGGDNSLSLPVGTHAHYNWGFTAPGIYEVTITTSGIHNDFGLVSDTQTITFGVEAIPAVPEPATYGIAIGLLLLGVTIVRRRQRTARTA